MPFSGHLVFLKNFVRSVIALRFSVHILFWKLGAMRFNFQFLTEKLIIFTAIIVLKRRPVVWYAALNMKA